MVLLDMQGAPKPRGPRRKCGTAIWIASLTDEQRAAIEYALSAGFAYTDIFKEARADGYPHNYDAFNKHVAGRCGSCDTH